MRMLSAEACLVFVYGTLQTGLANYGVVAPYVQRCRPAFVRGRLYHLPRGYPALVLPGGDRVCGQCLQLRPAGEALAALDALEEFYGPGQRRNEYERVRGTVWYDGGGCGEAFFYCWPPGQALEAGAVYLPAGDWRRYLEEQKKAGR